VTTLVLAWNSSTLGSHCGNFCATTVAHFVISAAIVSYWTFATSGLFGNSSHVTATGVVGGSGGASFIG